MSLLIELLASAHEADIEREVRDRRAKSVLRTCQRRLLGVVPIREACDPATAC